MAIASSQKGRGWRRRRGRPTSQCCRLNAARFYLFLIVWIIQAARFYDWQKNFDFVVYFVAGGRWGWRGELGRASFAAGPGWRLPARFIRIIIRFVFEALLAEPPAYEEMPLPAVLSRSKHALYSLYLKIFNQHFASLNWMFTRKRTRPTLVMSNPRCCREPAFHTKFSIPTFVIFLIKEFFSERPWRLRLKLLFTARQLVIQFSTLANISVGKAPWEQTLHSCHNYPLMCIIICYKINLSHKT